MSFDSLLINECDIQRARETATDNYGQSVIEWETIHDNEPCRYVSGKGREIKVGQAVVIIYDELFIGDIDVTEQDRVILDELIYQIISVIPRQDGIGMHHKHCFLEIVK